MILYTCLWRRSGLIVPHWSTLQRSSFQNEDQPSGSGDRYDPFAFWRRERYLLVVVKTTHLTNSPVYLLE